MSNPYQQELDWHGLYHGNSSRDDLLMPVEAVSHPAKMSNRLLARIVDQMLEWGWLRPGSVLCDPFGGTGRTCVYWCALDPRNEGVTVEIEPHFCTLQRKVKAYAEKRLGRALRWEIIEGDSRRVDELLAEAGCCVVSSPPYAGVSMKTGDAGMSDKESIAKRKSGGGGAIHISLRGNGYGSTPGNLGNLPDKGDPPGETPAPVMISSPPYASEDRPMIVAHVAGSVGEAHRRGEKPVAWKTLKEQDGFGYSRPDAAIGSQPFESQSGGHPLPTSGPLADPALHARHAASKIHAQAGYGPQTALGSPPFEDSVHGRQDDATSNGIGRTDGRVHGRERTATGDYGSSPSQIGAMQSESYSSACLAVYQALARAGVRYVALVVKCPTRGGKLRRLDQLTARLLRAAGYRVRAYRRAHLYEDAADQDERHGQGSLFGDEVPASGKKVGRLSFFRRLHLAKGGVAAKWEDVYFAELVTAGGEGCAVSSPPYGETTLRVMESGIAEPQRRRGVAMDGVIRATDYGQTEGQIGNLRDTDAPVCISSPPYADVEVMTPRGAIGAAWQQGKHARDTFAQEDKGARRYGRTAGQIGALPDTEPPAVVISSPPYSNALGHPSLGSVNKDAWGADGRDITARRGLTGEYGATEGQIGNLPDTPTELDR